MRCWEPPSDAEVEDLIARQLPPSLHAEAMVSICEGNIIQAVELCADNAEMNPGRADYWLSVAQALSGGTA
jgi:hypothetical protein